MKVTIKEIAADAGVSVSTVSRVISNNPRISEETKKRVNESIQRLNYKPNIIARGLVNKKTKILGVVMPKGAVKTFSSPFFIDLMEGISIKSKEENYYIMYDFTKDKSDEFLAVKKFVESGLVDGICLLSTTTNDKSVNYLKNINFPFVIIGEPEEKENTFWVDNNNEKATFDLVEKFQSSEKIAFIGAEPELIFTKNRVKGFVKGCEHNNILGKVFMGEKFSKEEGFNLSEKIIENENYRNIIVLENELLEGVLEFLEKKSIFDVKIYSFNKITLKNIWENKVFTIDTNPKNLGYKGIELLIKKVNNSLDVSHNIINIEI